MVDNTIDTEFPECVKCGGAGWIWSDTVPGLRKKCDCGGTGYIVLED